MTRIDLVYIHRFHDRHGKVRHYFHRPGFKPVALRGLPGSEEFMAAYQAAMAGQEPAPQIGASKTKPGTVSAAVVGYFNSLAFRALSPSTQATYRGVLEAFRAQHGDKRIALLQCRDINKMLSRLGPKHVTQEWKIEGSVIQEVAKVLGPLADAEDAA
jgi:hypothetical protein